MTPAQVRGLLAQQSPRIAPVEIPGLPTQYVRALDAASKRTVEAATMKMTARPDAPPVVSYHPEFSDILVACRAWCTESGERVWGDNDDIEVSKLDAALVSAIAAAARKVSGVIDVEEAVKN